MAERSRRRRSGIHRHACRSMLLHVTRNLVQAPQRSPRNPQPRRVLLKHKVPRLVLLRKHHRPIPCNHQRSAYSRHSRPRRRAQRPSRLPATGHDIVQPIKTSPRLPTPSVPRKKRPCARVIRQPSPRIRRHKRVARSRIKRPHSGPVRIPPRAHQIRLPERPKRSAINKAAIVVQVAQTIRGSPTGKCVGLRISRMVIVRLLVPPIVRLFLNLLRNHHLVRARAQCQRLLLRYHRRLRAVLHLYGSVEDRHHRLPVLHHHPHTRRGRNRHLCPTSLKQELIVLRALQVHIDHSPHHIHRRGLGARAAQRQQRKFHQRVRRHTQRAVVFKLLFSVPLGSPKFLVLDNRHIRHRLLKAVPCLAIQLQRTLHLAQSHNPHVRIPGSRTIVQRRHSRLTHSARNCRGTSLPSNRSTLRRRGDNTCRRKRHRQKHSVSESDLHHSLQIPHQLQLQGCPTVYVRAPANSFRNLQI